MEGNGPPPARVQPDHEETRQPLNDLSNIGRLHKGTHVAPAGSQNHPLRTYELPPPKPSQLAAEPRPLPSSRSLPPPSRLTVDTSAPQQRTTKVKFVPDLPPPSPNMAKRPRSVSMEVMHADKKTRASLSGSTLATSISEPADMSFIQRLDKIEVDPPEQSAIALEDERDPQMLEEYADQIFHYLYEIQDKFMVDPQYISDMPVSHTWPQNRRTLVNWMVAVHRRFRLLGETLYLAVNLVDRVISTSLREAQAPADVIPMAEMQLLSATCMFTAAKYEEVVAPSIEHFAEIARSKVPRIQEMERKVLVTINFDLGMPSPLNFLRRVSKANDYDPTERTLAKFLLEMSLFEPRLMAFRPSDVAAGAMLTVKMMLMSIWKDQQNGGERVHKLAARVFTKVSRPTPWNQAFEYYSGGLTTHALKPIVMAFLKYLRDPEEKVENEFIRKYESSTNLSAALLCREWASTTGRSAHEQE